MTSLILIALFIRVHDFSIDRHLLAELLYFPSQIIESIGADLS